MEFIYHNLICSSDYLMLLHVCMVYLPREDKIYGEEVPQTVEEKKAFLLRNHIAVWDVIASCVITGSSDASIRDVVPNPLQDILECADIRQIYCNGATAWKYYRKYQEKQLGREAVRLPSTSPANAAWSVERLLGEWSQCGEVLRNGE